MSATGGKHAATRILGAVRQAHKHGRTVPELREQCRAGEGTVINALSTLHALGLVEPAGSVPRQGPRGRPHTVYKATKARIVRGP
jgi:predicted transcriptional regulator